MRPPRAGGRTRTKRKQYCKFMRDTLAATLLVLVASKGTGSVEIQARGVHERGSLHPRTWREWTDYIRPILLDVTFRKNFRMEYRDFMALVDLVRHRLERNARMWALRNRAVSVEWQAALAVRYLAGGSMHDLVDDHCIGRTTEDDIVYRVIKAVNAYSPLNCAWPQGGEVERQAALYQKQSTNDVITGCVGAMDDVFIRHSQPSDKEYPFLANFYSGHNNGFGMKFQVSIGTICSTYF